MRGSRMLEAVLAAVCLVAGQCAFSAPSAPDTSSPMSHFGLATQPVPLPGAGKVILVFICVAALAVGIAAILRRWSPGLLAKLQLPSGVEVTVLGRQRLEPGVSLHIVSIAGERLAIVTSRSGVAMHALLVSGNDASRPTPLGDRAE
jgi:hypothetical protein